VEYVEVVAFSRGGGGSSRIRNAFLREPNLPKSRKTRFQLLYYYNDYSPHSQRIFSPSTSLKTEIYNASITGHRCLHELFLMPEHCPSSIEIPAYTGKIQERTYCGRLLRPMMTLLLRNDMTAFPSQVRSYRPSLI
jgi:hypothetical protein